MQLSQQVDDVSPDEGFAQPNDEVCSLSHRGTISDVICIVCSVCGASCNPARLLSLFLSVRNGERYVVWDPAFLDDGVCLFFVCFYD
jgi:hypothetical protein